MSAIVVSAAVIERAGAFLLTRRQPGVHLAGHWEFPGGKCGGQETLEECLRRELREELSVEARVGTEILTTTHDYGDRRVELHFFACELEGIPSPQQGQEMRWVPRRELDDLEFPAADARLVEWLQREPAARTAGSGGGER